MLLLSSSCMRQAAPKWRLESLLEEEGLGNGGSLGGAEHEHISGELLTENEAAMAGQRSLEALSTADTVVEALDMSEHEVQRAARHAEDAAAKPGLAPLTPNPVMLGLGPEAYALRAVAQVKPADLEQVVLALPFSSAMALLTHLKAGGKGRVMKKWKEWRGEIGR